MYIFVIQELRLYDIVQGHTERSKVIFTGHFELTTAISLKVFVVSS